MCSTHKPIATDQVKHIRKFHLVIGENAETGKVASQSLHCPFDLIILLARVLCAQWSYGCGRRRENIVAGHIEIR